MSPRALLLARAGAALAALLGVVLLLVGVTRGGGGASDETAGTTRLDGVAAVTTAPDVLASDGGRVLLEAGASTAERTVFVGVARAGDVQAWLGDLGRVEVLGAGEEGALDLARKDGATTAPDPRRADLWVASATGQGGARLEWTPTPGDWRTVAVVTGGEPGGLASFDVTWRRPAGGSSAPAFVATGLVLLVAGGVALLVLRRRSGPDRGEFYADWDDGGDDSDDDSDASDDSDAGGGAGGSSVGSPVGASDPDATTVLPRTHGRRRAGTPPWTARVALRVLAVGTVGVVGLAGCSGASSGPASSASAAAGSASSSGSSGSSASSGTAAAPGYPVVLVGQAESVLDKVDAAVTDATSGDLSDADEGRVLGPFADRLAAARKAAGSGTPSATSAAGMSRDRLVLTQRSGWPRFFLVAGTVPGRPTPVLRVLLSPSARDPYGVWAEPVLLPGATLPEVAPATTGAPALDPTVSGLAATPQQVAEGYADTLTRSTASDASKLFAPDEFRRQVASRLADDTKTVDRIGSVRSTHTVRPDGVLALRTADGGAVVVAALDATTTFTVDAGKGKVTVDAGLAALGGRSQYTTSLTRRSVEVVVLAVPPAGGGLVTVVAAGKDDVSVTGS